MEFVKILLMTILIIGMITSVVFGAIDIIKLAVDIGETGIEVVENVVDENKEAENMAQTINTKQDKDMLGIWVERLRDITFSALGLAVTFIGWKEVKEEFEDKDIKIYGKS